VARTGSYNDLTDKPTYYIVESGSNDNGDYIKFSDGTMICTKKISKVLNLTNSFGSLYETPDKVQLGDFPVLFISVPTVNVCISSSNGNGWLETVGRYTNSNAGIIYICSAVSLTNINYVINVTAIGKWK